MTTRVYAPFMAQVATSRFNLFFVHFCTLLTRGNTWNNEILLEPSGPGSCCNRAAAFGSLITYRKLISFVCLGSAPNLTQLMGQENVNTRAVQFTVGHEDTSRHCHNNWFQAKIVYTKTKYF